MGEARVMNWWYSIKFQQFYYYLHNQIHENKLLKKPLWVNILTGIGAFIVLLILFFFSLGWITGNGKTEKVPNVIGLDVTAAQKNLTALGFDVVLQDSIYVDTLARNAVLRQTPEADEIVKKGRTVYLTINRVIAPQVDMPNLVGFSIKKALLFLYRQKYKKYLL